MEKQDLLKVSLHGMNDRMQEMMVSFIENDCHGIAEIVGDQDAFAELVNVKTGGSFSLLKERLAQHPSKPIIALSSNKLPSKRAIHVLKPINEHSLSNAIKKVEKIISIEKVSSSIKSEPITKSILKKPLVTLQNKKKPNKFSVSGAIQSASKYKNRRSSVRYSFEPIKMTLKKKSVLGLSQSVPVLVLNNSSKGAYIHLKKPRRLQGNVILELSLENNKSLTVQARIVRKESTSKYGLRFLGYQHELTEYLINSGQAFNF